MAKVSLINTYQKYPTYKDSGVDWLGKIPEKWNLKKFKSVFSLSNERVEDDPSVEQILSVSGYRGIEKKDVSTNEGQMPSDNISQYRVVRPGQLVVNTMWLNYTGLGVSDYEGFVSPAYRAYTPSIEIDKRFTHYLMRSLSYVQKYSSLLYGIRPNSLQVKPKDFEAIEILIPPKEEQEKIAKFLDEQTAHIDESISKKQRLIELLKEKRTAVINNAVTKGLDPRAELVNSGIDWIGKIPKGWETKRFGIIADINASNIDKNVVEEQPVRRVCNYVDVYKNDYITNNLNFLTASATDEQIKKFSLKSGDIFLTKDSETADDIGVPAYVNETLEDVVVGYHIYQARVKDRALLPEFVFRFLQSKFARAWFENKARGVTRFGLGSYGVKSLPLTVPSYKEQKKIVEYLKEHSEINDATISKIKISITKLQELKSSLISHAVTGKIKV